MDGIVFRSRVFKGGGCRGRRLPGGRVITYRGCSPPRTVERKGGSRGCWAPLHPSSGIILCSPPIKAAPSRHRWPASRFPRLGPMYVSYRFRHDHGVTSPPPVASLASGNQSLSGHASERSALPSFDVSLLGGSEVGIILYVPSRGFPTRDVSRAPLSVGGDRFRRAS